MDAERIGKARGQFYLRVRAALRPLEMYGQKAYVDSALETIRMLNDIAVYESLGERPPENLVRKLADWRRLF